LNIPAADIGLRPEFQALLSRSNVDASSLITLDDLPNDASLAEKLKPENTRWILVDHNALQGILGSIYSEHVSGVIDHHDEERKVPEDTGDEPRIVEKAGSCTSLVTNYCREVWDNISSQALSTGAALAQDDAVSLNNDQAFSTTWDAQIAQVAIASILIDTNNLEDTNKVTSNDVTAAKYLEAKILASPQVSQTFDRDELFRHISRAKQDIGQLKLRDILRKDYKQWNEDNMLLGVSSVVKHVNFLIDKAAGESHGEDKTTAFVRAADAFAKDHKLGMFAIMTTSTSAQGDFQRELYLSATNTASIKAAAKFEKDSAEKLGLAPWHGSVDGINRTEEDCWRRIWQQTALQHSRKQVAPLLRKSMTGS
jgi:exopolyphosphatase